MKQNIVFKVDMATEKIKSKALKLAAGKDGVNSVKLGGGEAKDKIVVVGDDVDIVDIATSLKKKIGHTIIVSVRVLNSDNDDDNHERRYHESSYDDGRQLALTTSNYYHPSSTRNSEYYYNPFYPYLQPYPY